MTTDRWTIDDLIDQFVEDLSFDALVAWADMLKIQHYETHWSQKAWDMLETHLRLEVAEAMKKVGKKD